MKAIICMLGMLCTCGLLFGQTSWQSQIVFPGNDGRLVYLSDSTGNRIPDFSYAGYKNSNEPIPNVPVVMNIAPVAGDNTVHIQNAINTVAAMPLDSSGFRGALLLAPGEYPVSGILRVNSSGIVLRGSGDDADPATNTIIRATGNVPAQRDVLIAGGGVASAWADSVSGTRRFITSDSVMVGARSFEVSDASPYAVGDNIIIFHPATSAWLAAIDSGGTFSDAPGATEDDIPWQEGSQPIVYNRYITAINGNEITIDAPVYNHLIRSLSQSYIYTYSRPFLRSHIGIENLRIDIESAGGTDEDHAWSGIYLILVEDAWVRNCTVLHFGLSGVYTNTASRITIENCRALDPVSQITGGRRYNFNAYTASQQVLFKDCHASFGRHSYMSNGTSYTSGVVFLNCTSEGAYAASEGHRRWSQGLLYDNVRELDPPRSGFNPRRIGLYNRGYFGTSHGWSAVHSVVWNCDVNGAEIHVQQPPTGQNYSIGSFGIITGNRPPCSFDVPEGYIEGSNMPGLEPQSLFWAQLADRGVMVAIDERPTGHGIIAGQFQLHQNYPNPFNPTTDIRYQISDIRFINLAVFDVLGRKVRTLVKERQQPGNYSVNWDGRDEAGEAVSSGIYYYSLIVEGKIVATRKALLLR